MLRYMLSREQKSANFFTVLRYKIFVLPEPDPKLLIPVQIKNLVNQNLFRILVAASRSTNIFAKMVSWFQKRVFSTRRLRRKRYSEYINFPNKN